MDRMAREDFDRMNPVETPAPTPKPWTLEDDVKSLQRRVRALEAAYQGLADRLGVGGVRPR